MASVQKSEEAKRWGREAERLASEYLIAQGYVVRERNWRPLGAHVEVDIVVERQGVMAFVEVKARSGRDGDPVDAVDKKKQRNVCRAADAYLRMLKHDFEYRFDIIALTGNLESYTLEHIEDAFLPPFG